MPPAVFMKMMAWLYMHSATVKEEQTDDIQLKIRVDGHCTTQANTTSFMYTACKAEFPVK